MSLITDNMPLSVLRNWIEQSKWWWQSYNHGYLNEDLLTAIRNVKNKEASKGIERKPKVSLSIKGTWNNGIYTQYNNK